MKFTLSYATAKTLFKVADDKASAVYAQGFLAFEGGGAMWTNATSLIIVDHANCTGESALIAKKALKVNGQWLSSMQSKSDVSMDSEGLTVAGRYPAVAAVVQTERVSVGGFDVEELENLLATLRGLGVKTVSLCKPESDTQAFELVSVSGGPKVSAFIAPKRF